MNCTSELAITISFMEGLQKGPTFFNCQLLRKEELGPLASFEIRPVQIKQMRLPT
jgi:hypothetical protein